VRFTVAVVSIAVDELAKRLYVDPGDVRVILATLTDAIADAVSNELSGEVRMILDGFGFRTMPQL
jgi:CO/xanthine dehydrogenase Mo-binding subunit